ncbi:hypothetical protein MPER_09376 [Moniliophthora perniciosa FA553]|nr:hypothetical protein MPER_09376 [Moniliophthora perniciosa FA553]
MFGGKTSVGKESESDKENQESSGSTATAKDEKKGTIKEPMVRLDDFWALKVERPSWKEVIRRATFYLREQQFKEMCSSPIPALAYLQKEVSSVVNHSDPEEAESFRSLLTHLLSSGSPPSSPYLDQRDVDEDEPPPRKRSRSNAADGKPSTITSLASVMRRLPDPLEPSTQEELSEETFTLRNEVFEKILEFVNEDGKQTAGSLVDLFGVNVDPSP